MTAARDVVETLEDLAEANREKAQQAEEIDTDPERLRGCAEAYDDAAGYVDEQLVGEQRLVFPDDAEYEDVRLILTGLAHVMSQAVSAAMSGAYVPDGPEETAQRAHDFQIALLEANPRVAELILDEIESGDTVAIGNTEALEELVDEALGEERGEA